MALWRRAWDRLVYVALRAGLAALGLSSPEASARLALGAARLYMRIDRTRVRTVRENLRIAFGDRTSQAERDRLAVAVFEHFALLACELVWRPRVFATARAYRRRVVMTGDPALVLADLRAGQPAMVLSAHLGNWEFLGAQARAAGMPVSVVARPIDNPHVNRWLSKVRGGAELLIYKRGAVRSVIDALRRGRWVAVLADQNAGRSGEFLPFFGLPASTFPLGAAAAVRAGVPVYFASAVRRGRDFRYEVRLVRWRDDGPADEGPRERTRRLLADYTTQVEAWVREDPDQYFWMHRRWRTRPRGEKPGPHLPLYPERRKKRIPTMRANDAAARRTLGGRTP